MDYTPNNPTPLTPPDYTGVSQAANDLRSHSADSVSDFAATQPQTVKAAAVEKAQNFRAYAGEKAASLKGEATVKLKQGAEKAKELHSKDSKIEIYNYRRMIRPMITPTPTALSTALVGFSLT